MITTLDTTRAKHISSTPAQVFRLWVNMFFCQLRVRCVETSWNATHLVHNVGPLLLARFGRERRERHLFPVHVLQRLAVCQRSVRVLDAGFNPGEKQEEVFLSPLCKYTTRNRKKTKNKNIYIHYFFVSVYITLWKKYEVYTPAPSLPLSSILSFTTGFQRWAKTTLNAYPPHVRASISGRRVLLGEQPIRNKCH